MSTERKGPSAAILKDIDLADLDAKDLGLQFRSSSKRPSLQASMASTGQLNPIKVMSGVNGYRIIDGYTRVAAATELGWAQVQAVIYPQLDDRQAKKLAFVCNVERRNLSAMDRANAIHSMVCAGIPLEDVQEVFELQRRQIERYLALPEAVRTLANRNGLSLAHADLLAKASGDDQGGVAPERLDEIAKMVCEEGMSTGGLKKWLQRDGLLRRSRGRRPSLFSGDRDRIQVRAMTVTAHTGPQRIRELRRDCEQLLSRLRALEAGPGEDTAGDLNGSNGLS